ncbi:hypothetical protein DFH08DRAFT_807072 [Mycena albidolilacea]|uniref:Uncharacterized protein n=1 Tax=Mycena albidolilacea TaxID=1033008 RepID=A0AAD7ETG9_9AGAR|nr:hypothetical protein DFH08DRAFT_807072 [Mycena albidolilacea]
MSLASAFTLLFFLSRAQLARGVSEQTAGPGGRSLRHYDTIAPKPNTTFPVPYAGPEQARYTGCAFFGVYTFNLDRRVSKFNSPHPEHAAVSQSDDDNKYYLRSVRVTIGKAGPTLG